MKSQPARMSGEMRKPFKRPVVPIEMEARNGTVVRVSMIAPEELPRLSLAFARGAQAKKLAEELWLCRNGERRRFDRKVLAALHERHLASMDDTARLEWEMEVQEANTP